MHHLEMHISDDSRGMRGVFVLLCAAAMLCIVCAGSVSQDAEGNLILETTDGGNVEMIANDLLINGNSIISQQSSLAVQQGTRVYIRNLCFKHLLSLTSRKMCPI